MNRLVKVFILILFISILFLNDYQLGYTAEPTSLHQQTNSTQSVSQIEPIISTISTKQVNPIGQVISAESVSNMYEQLNAWLGATLKIEGDVSDGILSYNLDQNHKLYLKLYKDSSKTGYVVVKDDIEVVEFGAGHYIPYLPNIIFDEAIKELEPAGFFYYSPFESYWQYNYNNELVYIDGSSGEWLPELATELENNDGGKNFNMADRITESQLLYNKIFDPYDNIYWLLEDASPEQLTSDEIIELLVANERIIYQGTKYDNIVSFAFPIIGFQKSDTLTYFAIYDQYFDLIRFISYEQMLNYGSLSLFRDF